MNVMSMIAVPVTERRSSRYASIPKARRRLGAYRTTFVAMLVLVASSQWSVAQVTTYAGLNHTPLGVAQLLVVGDELHISNIGASGGDGVSIDVGEVDGYFWMLGMPPGTPPIGASMSSQSFGRVNGVPDQLAGAMTMDAVAGGMRVTPDFSSIGAATYELKLYRGADLVYSQSGMTGPAATFAVGSKKNRFCCQIISYYIDFRTSSGSESEIRNVTLNNGTVIPADRIAVTHEGALMTVDYFSTIKAYANQIDPITVYEEAIVDFGFRHQALGSATFNTLGGGVQLNGIGPLGDDGVSITLTDAHGFNADLEPVDFTPVNATMKSSARGEFGGVPDADLGNSSLRNNGAGGVAVTADFSGIGATMVRAEIFNGGAFVGRVVVPGGPIGNVTSTLFSVNGCGKLNPVPPDLPCFWWDFDRPVTFRASNGIMFSGNQLRILADNAVGTLNNLSNFTIKGGAIPSFKLIAESINNPPSPGLGVATDADDASFRLQVIPDGSTGEITVTYRLARREEVALELYDILGRRLDLLDSGEKFEGTHRLRYNLGNGSSGIYFVRLVAGGRISTSQVRMTR